MLTSIPNFIAISSTILKKMYAIPIDNVQSSSIVIRYHTQPFPDFVSD